MNTGREKLAHAMAMGKHVTALKVQMTGEVITLDVATITRVPSRERNARPVDYTHLDVADTAGNVTSVHPRDVVDVEWVDGDRNTYWAWEI